jgi:hypothetical protein
LVAIKGLVKAGQWLRAGGVLSYNTGASVHGTPAGLRVGERLKRLVAIEGVGGQRVEVGCFHTRVGIRPWQLTSQRPPWQGN